MSPVQSVTIRDFGQTHHKPVYLCETCTAPASFGFTILVDNHRKRRWYCRDHRAIGEALLTETNGDMGTRRAS